MTLPLPSAAARWLNHFHREPSGDRKDSRPVEIMNGLENIETVAHGVDKIARYGWTMRDSEGEFRKIHKRLLQINRDAYQREGFANAINRGDHHKEEGQ